ncbi:MAG: hypothetical protein JZU47_20670 [Prolixibacteraceae bacterium]|nr:hypothetical protein [Prolixibacteraceae bacterium]
MNTGSNFVETKVQLAQVSANMPFSYVVWCFWYDGFMNENRTRSLELMKANLGVPLCLITKENLNEFILPDNPLHPTFQWLSDVHKSDYMRIYLLHHYGGGWHDIKPTQVNFSGVWKEFDDPEVYLVGRPEIKGGPAKIFDKEGEWMPDCWPFLVGCGWWVGRPGTPLSLEMYQNINLFLDSNYEALKKYPAKTPFDRRKKNLFSKIPLFHLFHKGYPLPWTVFGNIFHPLNYKYRANVKNTLPFDSQYNLGLPYR